MSKVLLILCLVPAEIWVVFRLFVRWELDWQEKNFWDNSYTLSHIQQPWHIILAQKIHTSHRIITKN